MGIEYLADLESACGPDPGIVCDAVHGWTNSDNLARLAEWTIEKPATVLLILAVAWIASRVVRRAIDRFIARLIADPGREIHVLDLVASDEGVLRPGRDHRDGDSGSLQYGQAGLPVLDDSARDAYRRRLAEIDDDIDRARRMNDPARAELAEADRDYLIAELRRAVGLGGRNRTVGGSSERARTSVTRSIRYAIDQLAPAQPELASRLTQCVRTGTYCSFEPDAVAPIRWRQ